MMRLRIQHETRYRYARPVVFGRHRLVVRPREGHEQHVESMKLEISPAHRADWARDVFGNSILIVEFSTSASELAFRSDVIVSRQPPFPHEFPSEPWKIPFPPSYDPLESVMVAGYLTLTYPEEEGFLREWLETEFPDRDSFDAEGMLTRLGRLIYERIKYRRRIERGVQSPRQTLELQSGSCRDMATLLMDAARVLGVAARFASGYLDCAASEAGRASMHAWTELYLPTLGWRGFDPTLGAPTSLKHILAGVSNHPRGVMPISGMFSGKAGDYLDMIATVKIEKLSDEGAIGIRSA